MYFDATSFLGDLGIEFRTQGKNVPKDAVNIKCVFCGESRFHLVVHKRKPFCSCWVCKTYKPTVELVRMLAKCSWDEARELVFGRKAASIFTRDFDETYERTQPRVCELPKFTYPIAKNKKDPLLYSARSYLTERMVPLEISSEYNLHYGAYGDQAYRVIFPMYFGGKLVTYTGRDFTGRSSIRYKACPMENSVMLTTDILYGIDSFEGKKAIIVEGPVDKVVLQDNNVLGVNTDKLSPKQKKLLNSLELDELIIILDRQAYENGLEIAEYFRPIIQKIKVVKLPKKDPGILGKKKTFEAIMKTKYFDF